MVVLRLAAGASAGPAGATAAVHVRAATVAHVLRATFAQTQLRLHNLGREHADGALLSWHEPNASFVRLGRLASGAEARFTVPEHVVTTTGHGTLKYYVRETAARSMSVDWLDEGFRLLFRLESPGAALKGYHTAFPHSRRDIGAPDVHLKDARVTAIIPPEVRAGSLSYAPVRVVFDADVVPAGSCVRGEIDLCAELRRSLTKLAAIVEREVAGVLNREETRDRVAEALRPHLPNALGVVTAAAVSGDVVVITYRPR
jgi:hypothetical protein